MWFKKKINNNNHNKTMWLILFDIHNACNTYYTKQVIKTSWFLSLNVYWLNYLICIKVLFWKYSKKNRFDKSSKYPVCIGKHSLFKWMFWYFYYKKNSSNIALKIQYEFKICTYILFYWFYFRFCFIYLFINHSSIFFYQNCTYIIIHFLFPFFRIRQMDYYFLLKTKNNSSCN